MQRDRSAVRADRRPALSPPCAPLGTVRRFVGMNDFARLSPVALQWLFPVILLVLVVAIAFAPSWLTGLIGVVVFFTLGYGGVTLYYRRSQQLDKRNGLK
jgi:hypothetical protein